MTYGRYPVLAKPRMPQKKVILYVSTVKVVILKDNFFHILLFPKVLSDQMGGYITTALPTCERMSRNSLEGNRMRRFKHAVVG